MGAGAVYSIKIRPALDSNVLNGTNWPGQISQSNESSDQSVASNHFNKVLFYFVSIGRAVWFFIQFHMSSSNVIKTERVNHNNPTN